MKVPCVAPGTIWTTKVKTALFVNGRLAFVQLTVPFVPTVGVVHIQPPGEDIETKVTCGGRGSVNVALVAALGPPLLTVMV